MEYFNNILFKQKVKKAYEIFKENGGFSYALLKQEYDKQYKDAGFWYVVACILYSIPKGKGGYYLDEGELSKLDIKFAFMYNAYAAEHALDGKTLNIDNDTYTVSIDSSNEDHEMLKPELGKPYPDLVSDKGLYFDIKNRVNSPKNDQGLIIDYGKITPNWHNKVVGPVKLIFVIEGTKQAYYSIETKQLGDHTTNSIIPVKSLNMTVETDFIPRNLFVLGKLFPKYIKLQHMSHFDPEKCLVSAEMQAKIDMDTEDSDNYKLQKDIYKLDKDLKKIEKENYDKKVERLTAEFNRRYPGLVDTYTKLSKKKINFKSLLQARDLSDPSEGGISGCDFMIASQAAEDDVLANIAKGLQGWVDYYKKLDTPGAYVDFAKIDKMEDGQAKKDTMKSAALEYLNSDGLLDVIAKSYGNIDLTITTSIRKVRNDIPYADRHKMSWDEIDAWYENNPEFVNKISYSFNIDSADGRLARVMKNEIKAKTSMIFSPSNLSLLKRSLKTLCDWGLCENMKKIKESVINPADFFKNINAQVHNRIDNVADIDDIYWKEPGDTKNPTVRIFFMFEVNYWKDGPVARMYRNSAKNKVIKYLEDQGCEDVRIKDDAICGYKEF